MSIAELAMEYIRAHGTARSDEIEKELRISNVAAHLNPHVARGELVRCKVERPGKAPVNEYRISASTPASTFTPSNVPRGKPVKLTAAQPTGANISQAKLDARSPEERSESRAGRTLEIRYDRPMPAPRITSEVIANTIRAMRAGGSFVVKRGNAAAVHRVAKELGLRMRSETPSGASEVTFWREE